MAFNKKVTNIMEEDPKREPPKLNGNMTFIDVTFPIDIPADGVVVETPVLRAHYKYPLMDGVFIEHMSRGGIKIDTTAYFNNTYQENAYPDMFSKILGYSQNGVIGDVTHPSFPGTFKGILTLNSHTMSSKNIYGVEASLTIEEVRTKDRLKVADTFKLVDDDKEVIRKHIQSPAATKTTVGLIENISDAIRSVNSFLLQGDRYKNKYINKLKSITVNIEELIHTLERQNIDGGSLDLIQYYKGIAVRAETQYNRQISQQYNKYGNEVNKTFSKNNTSAPSSKESVQIGRFILTSRFIASYKNTMEEFKFLNPTYGNILMLKPGSVLYYYGGR